MKKMLILTVVAIMLTSLSGCCRGWPRLFGRGDSCAPACTTTMYEGADLGTGPALMAPSIVPVRPGELPGPVTTGPGA